MSRGVRFVLIYIASFAIAFIMVLSACSAGDTVGGGGGGGGGSSSSTGLHDGTNFVDTTNQIYANITNTNFVTNALTNGYTVTLTIEGDFSNDITNWLLELSGNLTITNNFIYQTNYTNYESFYTVVLTFTFWTNAFDTTNFWAPVVVTNITTNSNVISGGWEVFVTNYGYITNAVTNWLADYTNGVLVSTWADSNYEFLTESNTYQHYTNGITTNYFDTTNFTGSVTVTNVSSNTNFFSLGITNFQELIFTNFGYISNVVTNWAEELTNGATTSNWSIGVSYFASISNTINYLTNSFWTNAYDTTNFNIGYWVSNITTNSNAIPNGYEMYEDRLGWVSNFVTNWLISYTNGGIEDTWDTNEYVYETASNVTVVLYTNTYSTNNFDTTNDYGSAVVTSAVSNALGFLGNYWYTNIQNYGYISNVISNWLEFFTNGISTGTSNTNVYYTTNTATNFTTLMSNFRVHVGQELASDGNTVGIWNFNAGSGQEISDGSANGRNLTNGATGSVESTDATWTNWYTTGYGIGSYSNCLDFNSASSQYAWWNGIYNQGANITIEFWMKTTSGTGVLVSAGRSNYQVHLENGNIYFTVGTVTAWNVSSTSAANITNGEWHYIACIFPAPGTRQPIYIDGVRAVNTATTARNMNNVTNIYIGGRTGYGGYFNGQIDGVRIQNVAVAGATITTYYTTATNQ